MPALPAHFYLLSGTSFPVSLHESKTILTSRTCHKKVVRDLSLEATAIMFMKIEMETENPREEKMMLEYVLS